MPTGKDRGGERNGGGGIASHRFGEDIGFLERGNLLTHSLHMALPRAHEHMAVARQRHKAQVGRLNQRAARTQEVIQELRPILATDRPQTRSDTARGNDRVEIVNDFATHTVIFSHIRSDSIAMVKKALGKQRT